MPPNLKRFCVYFSSPVIYHRHTFFSCSSLTKSFVADSRKIGQVNGGKMRRISFINFCCDIRIHFFQARDLELCIYFWSSANSFCRIWKVRLDSEHATKVSTKNLYFECNGATIAVADGVNDSANGGFRFSFQRNFPFKSDNLNLVVKSQNRKMKNQQILRRDQNETFRESHSSRNFTESFPRIANCELRFSSRLKIREGIWKKLFENI